MIGNFEDYSPDKKQILSLIKLIKHLKRKTNITNVVGHREYSGTTVCPGKNIKMNEIRMITNTELGHTNNIFAYGSLYKKVDTFQPEYFVNYDARKADN